LLAEEARSRWKWDCCASKGPAILMSAQSSRVSGFMQDDLDKSAGERLRELRIASGKSQEAISFAANLDQSTLSKVERLGPGAVGWARFCRIAQVLGYEAEVTLRPGKKSEVKEARPAGPATARR
jgi:hypothetical protein